MAARWWQHCGARWLGGGTGGGDGRHSGGASAAAAALKEGVGGPFFAAPRAAQIKQPLDKK